MSDSILGQKRGRAYSINACAVLLLLTCQRVGGGDWKCIAHAQGRNTCSLSSSSRASTKSNGPHILQGIISKTLLNLCWELVYCPPSNASGIAS